VLAYWLPLLLYIGFESISAVDIKIWGSIFSKGNTQKTTVGGNLRHIADARE
jgi:hypothetical protein